MYGSVMSGLNQQFGNQISAYNAQQANDPMKAILGGAAGYGMKMLLA